MGLQELFAENKIKYKRLVEIRKNIKEERGVVCPVCRNEIKPETLRKKYRICTFCGYYFKMPPRERIGSLCDRKSFKEYMKDLSTKDPLEFPGYEEKLKETREKTLETEAVVIGTASVKDINFALAVMNGDFLMGSMGTVVGEKITALAEYAGRKKLPLVIVAASGGARMQEGLFSLMQMAKTAAAVERFKKDGGLFISCLTNPTTGGVSASFAMLGDIIIAEPNALICFAGPRVIEQTIGKKLPDGFQKSEFLLDHGMIDMIVERRKLKDTLYRIMKLHMPAARPEEKGE